MIIETLYDKNNRVVEISLDTSSGKSYELYVNGEFYCSCDSRSEVDNEISNIKKEVVEGVSFENKSTKSGTILEELNLLDKPKNCYKCRFGEEKYWDRDGVYCKYMKKFAWIEEMMRNGVPDWCPYKGGQKQ